MMHKEGKQLLLLINNCAVFPGWAILMHDKHCACRQLPLALAFFALSF